MASMGHDHGIALCKAFEHAIAFLEAAVLGYALIYYNA